MTVGLPANGRSHYCFFCQAEDGIRDGHVTGVQTCALPIWMDAALRQSRHTPGFAAVSGDGSLVQYLQSLASGTAPNPGVCLDCRSAASILVTKLFQPMYAELASDRGYVASTYQLLRP